MATNLEKPKDTKKIAFTLEQATATPGEGITVKDKDDDLVPDTVDDIDLDLEAEEDEPDEEDETEFADELADETEPEPTETDEPKPAKPKASKEQRQLHALKDKARRLANENAELSRKLLEKADSDKTQELVAQYVDEGLSEAEAKRKAKDDIRQTTLEKRLEMLEFERANRTVLSRYNVNDADLQKILAASKLGVLSVEQVCRGLYGSVMTDKEKRAASAFTAETDNTQSKATVASAARTAASPERSVLTDKQKRAKLIFEQTFNKGKKPLTDKEFLAIYPH